ncbi:MAG: kelch repeat-containing protein, partial [Patescibacteria group bacterium]
MFTDILNRKEMRVLLIVLVTLFLFSLTQSAFAMTASNRVWSQYDELENDKWEDAGVELPRALQGSQVAVIGEYVYLFGGLNARGIFRAP